MNRAVYVPHATSNESEPAMNTHWANHTRPLTDADLRLLHDQAHDPHPEQPEHERIAPTATTTSTPQEHKP